MGWERENSAWKEVSGKIKISYANGSIIRNTSVLYDNKTMKHVAENNKRNN